MELKLNVSKVLMLDTKFKGEMLANNQAIIGETEGETVMMVKVNIKDITDQVKKQTDKLTKDAETIGVCKEELFKHWVDQFGYNKAVLFSCNYPVMQVVKMSEEDAESEVQAIE